jgi:hypothetical protein
MAAYAATGGQEVATGRIPEPQSCTIAMHYGNMQFDKYWLSE